MKTLNICFVFIFVSIFLVFVKVNTLTEEIFTIDNSSKKYINDDLNVDHHRTPHRGKRSSGTEISLLIDNFRNAIFKEMKKQKKSIANITENLETKINGVNSSVAVMSEKFKNTLIRKLQEERFKTSSEFSKRKEDFTRQIEAERLKTSSDISKLKEDSTRQIEEERLKTISDISKLKEDLTRQFQAERLKASSDISNLKENFTRQLQTERLKTSSDISKMKADLVTEVQNLMTELRKMNETLNRTVSVQQDLQSG